MNIYVLMFAIIYLFTGILHRNKNSGFEKVFYHWRHLPPFTVENVVKVSSKEENCSICFLVAVREW